MEIKTGRDIVFQISFLDKHSLGIKHIKEKLTEDIEILSMEALGKVTPLIPKWLSIADIIFIAKNGEGIKGIATGKYIKDNIILLHSTLIAPSVQNMKLATSLNTFILNKVLFERIRKNKWKFWNFFSPFYFVFRTPNPRVYKAAYNSARVFPSPENSKPPQLYKQIAKEVVSLLCPDCQFCEDTFIIKGAMLEFPEWIYDEENIPWSDNDCINAFLENRLKLKNKEGNEILVIGKLSSIRIFRQIINLLTQRKLITKSKRSC